jgi:hypothetical protein
MFAAYSRAPLLPSRLDAAAAQCRSGAARLHTSGMTRASARLLRLARDVTCSRPRGRQSRPRRRPGQGPRTDEPRRARRVEGERARASECRLHRGRQRRWGDSAATAASMGWPPGSTRSVSCSPMPGTSPRPSASGIWATRRAGCRSIRFDEWFGIKNTSDAAGYSSYRYQVLPRSSETRKRLDRSKDSSTIAESCRSSTASHSPPHIRIEHRRARQEARYLIFHRRALVQSGR